MLPGMTAPGMLGRLRVLRLGRDAKRASGSLKGPQEHPSIRSSVREVRLEVERGGSRFWG